MTYKMRCFFPLFIARCFALHERLLQTSQTLADKHTSTPTNSPHKMLHHIGFVVTTISAIVAAFYQHQEELLKHAELNSLTSLASSRHSVPEFEPATVNFITFPAFEHTCRPCPSTGDPVLEATIVSSANLEYEERLHSEQHAHRLRFKEALLRDRAETREKKEKQHLFKFHVDRGVRNAITKMKCPLE